MLFGILRHLKNGVLLGMFALAGDAYAMDADGNVTAASVLSEPVSLPSTANNATAAVDLFDFNIVDSGTSDTLDLIVTRIAISVGGTSDDNERSNIVWRLDGAGANNIEGTYDINTDEIIFDSLGIVVLDGMSEVYTINAYFTDNTDLTEGRTYLLSVDGDTSIDTDPSGTQIGATTTVDNGTGTSVSVEATRLVFTTQPSSSSSGSILGTQPIIEAQDIAGNLDTDFNGDVLLSEGSAGTLSGNIITAVSGVATFLNVRYTATADNEDFTLTADEAGSLTQAVSQVVTSDIQATRLVYATEPAGSVSGVSLVTQPVVRAENSSGILDTDFDAMVTLSETSLGSLSGNTLTAINGIASFTDLTYFASVDQENFILTASSVGLTAAVSSSITSDVVATQLNFSTAPTSSISNTILAVQPVVEAVDAEGILDQDFDRNVSLDTVLGTDQNAPSLGEIIIGNDDSDDSPLDVFVAAISGVATFENINFLAADDNEEFRFVASERDAPITLTNAVSGIVVSEIVATRLAFFEPPTPTFFLNTIATDFDVTLLIYAVGPGNDIDQSRPESGVDQDFNGEIVLSIPNALGTYILTGDGDQDADEQTITLTAVNGIASFDNARLTYTAAGTVNETFNLRASTPTLDDVDSDSILLIADGFDPRILSITRFTPFVERTNTNELVWRIRFSEEVRNVTPDDFMITGATASVTNITSSESGRVYDLTVSGGNLATVSGVVQLAVSNSHDVEDLSGNNLTDLTPVNENQVSYILDNTPPVVAISAPSLGTTTTTPVTFTIAYTDAEAVSLAVSDITLNRTGTANATVLVSGTGDTDRIVTITNIVGAGTLGITLAAATAVDDLGNTALATAPSSTVTVTNASPIISVSPPSRAVTRSEDVSYNVTYTGATGITLAPADIMLNRSGTAMGDVVLSGTGNTRTITIQNITGDGTLSISLEANTAVDALANRASAFGPSIPFEVDNTAPRLQSIDRLIPTTEFTSADELTWRLTFNDEVRNVDTTDLVITGAIGAAVSVIPVDGDGASFDVRLAGGDIATLNGEVQLTLNTSTDIEDLAGNLITVFEPSDSNNNSYQVDNQQPSVSITLESAVVAANQTTTVNLLFNEPVTGLDIEDISVENAQPSNFAVDSSNPLLYTLTLTANNISDNMNIVSIVGASYTDRAGNIGQDASSDNYRVVSVSNDALERISLAAGTMAVMDITLSVLNSLDGIVNAVDENEAAYQAALAALDMNDVDTISEIQALINSVNALQRIQTAAGNNDASSITFIELNDVLGVLGAIGANEDAYQTAIERSIVSQVDSAAEVQALVTSVNTLILIQNAANTNDATDIDDETLNDVIGVSRAVAANNIGYQNEIERLSADDVNRADKLQALVNEVNGFSAITSYADNNFNSPPSVFDFLSVGVVGVTTANLMQAQQNVAMSSSTDTDSLQELLGVIGISLLDSDSDGIADISDADDDNDGISDVLEDGNAAFLTGQDTDRDGVDDGIDASIVSGDDSNVDGIVDSLALQDADGDGIVDIIDVDSDNDGIPDAIEFDGVNVDQNGDGRLDAILDANMDGLHDFASMLAPVNTDADSDASDSLVDIFDTDSDGDGISDYTETASSSLRFMTPENINTGAIDSIADQDRDGLLDEVDPVNIFTSAGVRLIPADQDGDQIPDFLDADNMIIPEPEVQVPTSAPVGRKVGSISPILCLLLFGLIAGGLLRRASYT